MPPPLADLKILDFSTLLPGPYATMILADLGADVLRIEAPGRSDISRSSPPLEAGLSVQHAVINRSKRSLLLDLKKPAAVEVVQRLVQRYDVVVEQFRPGVMDRLGAGYPQLRQVNPDLIYCSLTGYGQNGPYSGKAGHDLNYLALAGLLSYAGRVGETPAPMPVQVADVGGGSLFLVIGLLAAWIRRQSTGQGGHVDISMLDGSLAWNNIGVAHTIVGRREPRQEGQWLNGGSFYDCYRTRDDRYLSVASLEPKFWAGFCRAIDRPDLIDAGMDQADLAAQQTIKTEIRRVIRRKTLAEWTAIFAEIDVCVEPVLTTGEAVRHAQVQARQMITGVPRHDGSLQPQVATPVKMTGFEPSYAHIGSQPGAHSREALSEAGYTAAEVEALLADGAAVAA